LAFDHYLDRDTGIMLKPEYTTMSRRPGIAAGWFKKSASRTHRRNLGYVSMRGGIRL
jgi:hypothetical protein